MAKSKSDLIVPDEIVMSKILLIRGKKVMIDKDLAELYGVPTKRLNEQVKRNINAFQKTSCSN
jgi:ribosomal protein L21